eukprot:scaffold563311_cov17-Prasinocladus_malaysianus.AAC.1
MTSNSPGGRTETASSFYEIDQAYREAATSVVEGGKEFIVGCMPTINDGIFAQLGIVGPRTGSTAPDA